MASQQRTKVIVNPIAGRGSTGKKYSRIQELLNSTGLSIDQELAQGRGHAKEIAQRAASDGYELVVAVGGDGTLNEVANGLLSSGKTDISLGIVDTGTGSGFAHSLGIPHDYRQACLRLASPQRVDIDVGVIEYQDKGQVASRFFIGAASLGYEGEVVEFVSSRYKPSRGVIPYLIAMLDTAATYRNKSVHLQLNEEHEDIRICNVIIANVGFLNRWMPVAAGADLNDGLFDVILVGDIGKWELVQIFLELYRGKRVTHPKVRVKRASKVAMDSSERVLVQAEGELLGEVPANFRVLPSALRLVV